MNLIVLKQNKMMVSCLRSSSETNNKKLWQGYLVGRGRMLVKYELFGFTQHGEDMVMDEHY